MTRSPGLAASLYHAFVESLAVTGYGLAETVSAFQGIEMPTATDKMIDVYRSFVDSLRSLNGSL